MDYKMELLEALLKIADEPENEFDKFIAQNKDTLYLMDTKLLRSLIQVRTTAARMCQKIPFTREEIRMLIENKEVSVYNLVAKLEDQFNIADYFFTIARGEKY